MRIENPGLGLSVEPIPLERCQDDEVPAQQLEALQDNHVMVASARTKIAGARVRYTHLTPSAHTDEVPIGIVNGFCGTESAYKQLAIGLALAGREVFYIRPPRTQTPFMALQPEHIRDVLKLQAQATWGAMKAIRSYTDHEQFDLYGHSMGVPISLKAAEEKREYIRSLVLAGGAGLNGRNTFFGMVRKTIDVARNDVAQGHKEMTRYINPLAIALDTAHHTLRRPDRTIREGFTVARIDARPTLQTLKRATGIRVGAILFENDGYFKWEEVMSASGAMFDKSEVTQGATHIYPQDHPLEHASDVHRMLQNLASPIAPLAQPA